MDSPFRILVLEDDPQVRSVLATVLAAEGYAVETADQGAAAVEKARQTAFDLVIADVRMPGIDGLEAFSQMRQHRPELAGMVVTGYASEADSIRAIKLGMGDYLRKPFDTDQLLDAVGRLAARTRLEREREAAEQGLFKQHFWSLQFLSRVLDRTGSCPGLEQMAASAERLGGRLGLRPLAVGRSIAALVAQAAAQQPHLNPCDGLTPELEAILSHLEGDDPWEQAPVEAQVARVARAACQGEPLEGFHPAMVEALGPVFTPDPPMEGPERRSLLSLARALEEAGNEASARQAYEQLLAAPPSRERVAGLLGLARLACTRGETTEASHHALEATRTTLGPGLSATAYLEAGLLLRATGHPEALALLERALGLFRSLGQDAGAARALLGGAAAGQPVAAGSLSEALVALSRPEHSAELAASADWLLGYLLELDLPERERPLRRLVRDAPRALARLVGRGQMSPHARRSAAEVLGQTGGDAGEAVLRALEVDPDACVREAAARSLQQRAGVRSPRSLRIYSLGPMEVYCGQERVHEGAWKSQKVKFLFAFLAGQRARPVAEDILLEHFWPDELEKGKRNLNWSASMLRAVFRAQEGEPAYLCRERGQLFLNPEVTRWHDFEELEDLLGPSPLGLGPCRRVLDLYRGPYLEGCYFDWALQRREQVEARVVEALWAALPAASPAETVELGTRLLDIDPCHQA
ncbi:MAG: response regulator, partial [Candidatus Eremiobacterota bacterium]